jgi:hypothetical protein
MVNKYTLPSQGDEMDVFLIFLVYNPNGEIPKDGFSLELMEENINLLTSTKDHKYPIFHVKGIFDIFTRDKSFPRDRILMKENICSFYDLQCAYNLLRTSDLKKSRRVRDFVEEKYSEIVNMDY